MWVAGFVLFLLVLNSAESGDPSHRFADRRKILQGVLLYIYPRLRERVEDDPTH